MVSVAQDLDLGLLDQRCASACVLYVLDIDDCDPNPCKNSGTCSDGVNSHTCNCAIGLLGVNCETSMSDTNLTICFKNAVESHTHPHKQGFTCVRRVGSFLP